MNRIPHHFLGLLGLSLSALSLSACGDPCLDDGAGKPGAECDSVASADGSGTDSTSDSDSDSDSDSMSGSESESDSMTTVETDSAEAETSDPEETWCYDLDMDGFGDPDNCEDVPAGDDPPDGTVPEEQATDCVDDDPNTFPGAAQLEDPEACMTDADDDGWGDEMPSNPAAAAGTDCDDANQAAFPGAAENEDPPDACMEDSDDDGWGDTDPSGMATLSGTDCDDDDPMVLACDLWCPDVDMDGFGDDEGCVFVDPDDPDDTPPDGFVDDDTDCDDNDDHTFPGAAEDDDPEACMSDADEDGWGDDMPNEGVTPGRDCDDSDEFRVVCVNADPACVDTTLNMATQLMATATGGDGNYTFSWEPPETLDDPNISDPMATPTAITTYTVTATDGLGNMGTDPITVHLTDRPWVLGGVQDAECEAVGLTGPAADHDFSQMGTQTCTISNSDPTAFVCPTIHERSHITGTMGVTNDGGDDDWVGFVWGWQDVNQFYMFHWKRSAQNVVDCSGVAGMVVKKVDAQGVLTPQDLGCQLDTANVTVLATPQDTYDQGWISGREYGVDILYDQTQTEITITDLSDDSEVANFVIMDDSYPNGQFGTYDWSQINACNGPWQSSCL